MWFDKIKSYYNSGMWSAEMVSNAVAKGKITESEYREITGESYSGGSVGSSLEDRVSALEEMVPSMAESFNNLAEADAAYQEGVNSI